MKNREDKKQSNGILVLGIGLLLLGVVSFMEAMDVLPYIIEDFVFDFRTLLIFLGAIIMSDKRKSTAGLVLLVVGIGLYLFDWIGSWLQELSLPFMFMIAGIFFLVIHRRRKLKSHKDVIIDKDGKENYVPASDFVEVFTVLGNTQKKIEDTISKVMVTTVLGAIELDLTGCEQVKILEIDVSCIFGSITLKVPKEWRVHSEINTFLGSFKEHNKPLSSLRLEDQSELNISGNSVFGSVEVIRV